MIDGNRCEACRTGEPVWRVTGKDGRDHWLCAPCFPGWAARHAGLEAKAATPVDEARLSEEVVASLQGQLSALRDDFAGLAQRTTEHHGKLDDQAKELRWLKDKAR